MTDYEAWENNPKYQDFWRRLIDILKEKRWDHRIKEICEDKPSQWEDGLIEPVECCIESGKYGPLAKWEVEWVEVDPILKEYIGRLLPIKKTDYTEYLCEKLTAVGIKFSIVNHNIRINTALEW
jgi:hypothetical protein